jgi:hypothetical protein
MLTLICILQIRFSFKRVPLRRMHEAINQSHKPPNHAVLPLILFPTDNLTQVESNNLVNQILVQANTIAAIDRNLNQQQMRAVSAIMLRSSQQAPYVVFGPPGTHKFIFIILFLLVIIFI